MPSRLDCLRTDLEAGSGLLVTNLTNIRYLSGFTGSAGLLFVLPDRTVLLTDGRYATQAREQVSGAAVEVAIAPAASQREVGSDLVTGAGVESLGLEAQHVSWARQQAFNSEWFPEVPLRPTDGLVERLREIKDGKELAAMGAAAAIADEALADLRPRLASGLTEVEFGRALDLRMREMGASGPSFETIVASGPNGAKPHHRPGTRSIGRNEPVVVDFGARVDGYCSDMTRTVWVGALSDPDLRRAYDVVLEAQAAGVAAVRAGVACVDVDRACRELIASAGWAEGFVHGTGHGVGLDIHEAPALSATSTDTLAAGQVVTVEPGIYLPGIGGIRIEDTLIVTEEGSRPLTLTDKDRP